MNIIEIVILKYISAYVGRVELLVLVLVDMPSLCIQKLQLYFRH